MSGSSKRAVALHRRLRGKIQIQSKMRIRPQDIQLIYTPGVAAVCKRIGSHPSEVYSLTSKANNVAIVTDGTRILGLGNIGPHAALPVMEGKAVLYKKYGNVDAFPICLSVTKKEQIVDAIRAIEPAFGAINLEDIESPKVLQISDMLSDLPIPVFHDDRHGTAVAALAGILNSLRITGRDLKTARVVIAGAGSAGYGICELLSYSGCGNITVADSAGVIHGKRKQNMNPYKYKIAKMTDASGGSLSDALAGADVFVGVSGVSGILSAKMVRSMAKNAIVFALTNPEPEITVRAAKKAGARIVATGSYQYKNRVNNAIVFPYLMRVILDRRIRRITPKILCLAAHAIADSVPQKSLGYDNVVPEIGNRNIQRNIKSALAKIR